ncbi:MAG: family HAD-type hydrolase [Alphaproteobacteria bacterium]|jgi:HAD superfamily hydrolase (TIGR01459 family)|nr:family HAD-type hydrolase [Alphaproteobacteria bacterium]
MIVIKPANDQLKMTPGLYMIANNYDGFILDLWGVVHDGLKPYAKTVETLRALKDAKRIVWMLSNAPRRAHVVAGKLTEMGIGPELYDGIMTSGEATWMALKERYLNEWGKRCYHLGPADKDGSLYEGLDIEIVKKPSEADFVLNSGVNDFDDTADMYQPVLDDCLKAGLPMLCANPDRIVHVGDKLVICPGTFADTYAAAGGDVTYFGKPHRGVYSLCLQGMGVSNVLCIGDGMQTDIEGANGAGLDSILITSGIHREAFPVSESGVTGLHGSGEFLKSYPYRPTYLMSALRWE